MNVKQVIVIRKDLNMRKGKMVAQGGHAIVSALFKDTITKVSDGLYEFRPPKEMEEWLFNSSFIKICVSVDSEIELIKTYTLAIAAGLPASLIQDKGHTEFHGVPTYTAVAVGPGNSQTVDIITGKFPLL